MINTSCSSYRFTNPRRLNLIHLPDKLQAGAKRLLKSRNCVLNETGMQVLVSTGETLRIQIQNEQAEIVCPEHLLLRGLGLLLENLHREKFLLEEQPKFHHLGAHLDMSRNGIMTVTALKAYMDTLALMGYNQVYLYLEDMFEIYGRPYFGYLRGRYTAAELKELDDHAYSIGIELIPSIQALGHHEQYLRWQEAASIRDTQEVLLADSEETYAFIEQMIRTVTASLRSKKIMLGMDETHTLGLGAHLRRFGYEQPKDIFLRHLQKVFTITDKLGLEGMIASDMFFRLYSSDHDYYTPGTEFPPEVSQMIPENATLVYWHYGESPGCDREMVEKHKQLNRKTVFFGGTWTWSGHLPDTDYARTMTREALAVCEEYGMDTVVQTLWFDDGNECSHLYGLLTVQETAEIAFGHRDECWLSQRFHFCTGADADAFMDMSAYQCIFDADIQYGSFVERFRGKTLFWQDVLLGQADAWLQANNRSGHYGSYAERFRNYAENNFQWEAHYRYIETVFRYLSSKCAISERLTVAYAGDNRQELRQIRTELDELLMLARQCHAQHKRLWMESYKPFGWEVLDHRYGGTEARILTAQERLDSYLTGEITKMEELEQKRLDMTVSPWNPFSRIVTGSVKF